MTKKMRIKEVGGTINLGQYSSLHVTIGEPSEYTGLSLDKATTWLREIAKSVDGVINLPDTLKKTDTKKEVAKKTEPTEPQGQKVYCFGGTTPIWYDHKAHSYVNEKGIEYESVTQVLGHFYPFNADDKIKQEYMDFASSYGNLIHTAIQNAVIGMPPKKKMVQKVISDALNAMGDYDKAWVEQTIALPDQEIAGRFDILTMNANKNSYTLWDVKTNSDLTLEADCCLPNSLVERYNQYWNPKTIYGEHCLQLNLYAYIIEQTTDIKIDEIKIIHVPDGFKKIFPVPKVDVSDLLSAYGSVR